jgi:adenosylhomocysteinase
LATPTAAQTAAELERINTFFPLLPRLGNRWAQRRPWEDMCVAVNAHLTSLTAILLRELALGGGRWVVSAANAATTDMGVVNYLREQGVAVYTEGGLEDRHLAALDHDPVLLADVGFELTGTLLDKRREQVREIRGAVEITRTGISRLRQRDHMPLGVININDGRLKPRIENRHGVGEGLWDAIRDLTGMHLAGRRVAVVGYGPVGQGLAAYGRAAGAVVEVVEVDPIQRLVAHYDGFPTPELDEALSRVAIAVTATGRPDAIPLEALERARSGLVLVNGGHGGDEIAVRALPEVADRAVVINRLCQRYKLPDGPWLTVLADGHPLNIVVNAGSPEPVLLHFALLGLTLEWLTNNAVQPGEIQVPAEIERHAATLALEALSGNR